MSASPGRVPIWIPAAACASLLLLIAAAFLWSRGTASERGISPGPRTTPSEAAARSDEQDRVELREPESRKVPAEVPVADFRPAVEAGASSSGIVVAVRDPDGFPIPGAQVEFTTQGPHGTWICDTDGRCELPVEPRTGVLELRVRAAGFVTTCRTLKNSAEIAVGMTRSVAVRGRVVAADDRSPVPGARITLGVVGCGERERIAHADDEGRFELSGVPLERRRRWWVSADGFATLERVLDLRDPALEIELELTRGVPLEISFVDAQTGAPIEGVELQRLGGEAKFFGAQVTELSDAKGRVRTSALLSPEDGNEVFLAAEAPGYCCLDVDLRRNESDPKPLRFPKIGR